MAVVEEIGYAKYFIPELSFVAELDGKVVGHFLFSKFPLSPTKEGEHDETDSGIVMLAPVSVHADYFRQGIGTAMLLQGIEKVRELCYKGITVEGNYKFYNRVGFRTSSEYHIFPTSGYPMQEPRCMMCQETYEGALDGIHGLSSMTCIITPESPAGGSEPAGIITADGTSHARETSHQLLYRHRLEGQTGSSAYSLTADTSIPTCLLSIRQTSEQAPPAAPDSGRQCGRAPCRKRAPSPAG